MVDFVFENSFLSYMDLNAKYEKLLLRFYYDSTAIDPNKDISKTRQVHVK